MLCPQQNERGAEVLIGYSAGTLQPQAQLEFERHLSVCEKCRDLEAEQQAVWETLGEWRPTPVAAQQFDKRLYARIAREAALPWWRRALRANPSFAFRSIVPVAAACTALAVTFLVKEPAMRYSVQNNDRQKVSIEQVERALDDMDMLKQMSFAASSERRRYKENLGKAQVRPPKSIVIPALLMAVVYSGGNGLAQGHRGGGGAKVERPPGAGAREGRSAEGPAPVEEFERMSPDQREKALQKLPPERQEKIRQQLQRYDQLSPGQKEQLQRLWALSPDRRQQVRKSIQDFSDLPQDRKRAVNAQFQQLESMAAKERKSYFNSPDFKSRFNSEEQKMIKNMAELLPARAP